MKKKVLCALAVAMGLTLMPMAVGAAISPSGSGSSSGSSSGGGSSSSSGGSSGSSQTGTTVVTGTDASQSAAGTSSGTVIVSGPVLDVSATGEKTTVVEKGTDKQGATISLVVNIQTSDGVDVVANQDGHAQIGETVVSIATDVAETAGLPQEVVATINQLNTSNDITIVAPDKKDYIGVGGTRAIVSKNQEQVDVKAEITMKVDSLVGAGEILVVYYNNNTGKWEIAYVRRFDSKNGMVTFEVPGSVTVKFAKRR